MSEDTPSPSIWSISGVKRLLSTTPKTREELLTLVEDSTQFLQPETIEMLQGVLDLPETQVREIMTPRPNVTGADESMTLDDIMKLFLDTSHSRYPVFDNQDDDAVIGILLAKDLIPIMLNLINNPSTKNNHSAQSTSSKINHISIKDLVHQPVYINENSRSDILLRSLQKAQVHMAVVVDDFGNFAGVVTMEDLLEEIVGDIVDEHDDLEEDSDHNNILAHPSEANIWTIQATTPIEDCNEILQTQFDNIDVDTIGGLVMKSLGNVSHLNNQTVTINGWKLTTLEVDGRFIQTVQLTKVVI